MNYDASMYVHVGDYRDRPPNITTTNTTSGSDFHYAAPSSEQEKDTMQPSIYFSSDGWRVEYRGKVYGPYGSDRRAWDEARWLMSGR